MSIPIKHHYLARFYLRRWADPNDGKVVEYRRPHNEVVQKRKFPSATAFQPHLYALTDRDDEAARQEIESEVMSPLDSLAAEALTELETSGTVVEPRLRVGWARFISSLMYRSPHRIEGLRQKFKNFDTASLEVRYAELRSAADPASAAEFLAQADTTFIEEGAASLLTKLVSPNRLTTDYMVAMRWAILRLVAQDHDLLTGDDPVITSNGVKGRDGFLLAPVGPSSLFLATNNQETMARFIAQLQSSKSSTGINDAICRQAHALVIGNTAQHLRFVERRLGVGGKMSGLDRKTWLAP